MYSTRKRNAQKCFIAGKWLLSPCHQYANGKMDLECGEYFPQVHSLATITIIDSQYCHKTGHSQCFSLWGGGSFGDFVSELQS